MTFFKNETLSTSEKVWAVFHIKIYMYNHTSQYHHFWDKWKFGGTN